MRKLIPAMAITVLALGLFQGGAALARPAARAAGSRSGLEAAYRSAPQKKVGPHTRTQVPSVYDCDDQGLGGPCDMQGAVNGTVLYSQSSAGDLLLTAIVRFALPHSTYQMFLTCGPAHALACGYTRIGSLTTNGQGRGTAAVTVPVGALRSSPYGAGYRTDHLDLLRGVGDISTGLVATGALNYFVPTGTTTTVNQAHPGDPA
jgi:hypothetical protein